MLRGKFAHACTGLAILGAVGVGPVAALASDGADLVSHRALYALTLERAHTGSGVTGVRGEMAIEWLRGCDGWTFEHQSTMALEFAAGEAVDLATSATSWESFDGLRYRFSLRNRTNDSDSERVEGTASIARKGGPGRSEFAEPKPRVDILPAGTLFPVAHTVEVLRAAQRTPREVIFPGVVFDGMGDEGPFTVTTTIGREHTGAAPGEKPAEGLADIRMWPVHLAYFRMESADPKPKQEIGMWLYTNGVADKLMIGFDDFVVRARLTRLDYVKPSDCGG